VDMDEDTYTDDYDADDEELPYEYPDDYNY